MGKKNKKEKKGKEKTILKTEKKAAKKAKKDLADRGEDDIEKLIAEFQADDLKRIQVQEEKCLPPSPRSSMTLCAHPDKDELVMFGGEYLVNKKLYMYNDLLFYNIKKDEWLQVVAPNAPPPRSSHQAVALKQAGGQLWIFGGEFASPTQSQFYHYKDLWVYFFREKKWEKVNSPGGPSARSGHRMISFRKQLLVFGGFHDNIRDYKYFNDVHAFNLETYTWSKVDVSGSPPEPRSSCMLLPLQDQTRVMVYGGYSKERVKKDVDRGKTHTDMFLFMPEGRLKEENITKWKWQSVKQSGTRPSARCGFSAVVVPGNRSVCFGGVYDEEENEEQLRGVFYNEMYSLELDKYKWHDVLLRGKKTGEERKKRRRKNKPAADGDDVDVNEDDLVDCDEKMDVEEDIEIAEEIENIVIDKANDNAGTMEVPEENKVTEDGVFTVTIGTQSETPAGDEQTVNEEGENVFQPCPRMNPLLVVKNGILYMYGGVFEIGDKQMTLSDFYSLDLHKLDEWNIIIKNELPQLMDDSDSSSSDEEMDGACGGEEEEESDEDMELTFEDAPDRKDDEDGTEYYDRTKEYWFEQARSYCQNQGLRMSDRKLAKLASEMCLDVYEAGND